MGDTRPPVSQSDLYKYGKSLLPGSLSARLGLASALADVERSAEQAKVLHNFQMVKKRYVWTTHGIGYTKDNASVINAGARLLEFGKFYDSTGALNMLVQAGANIYVYNTATHAVGAAITLPYVIDAAAVPCMRPYSPSTLTAQPITIWCNGVQNPIKITSTAASSALQWQGNYQQETATISGAVVAGNVTTLTLTNANFVVSPIKVSYTAVTGDTFADIAAGLTNAINASTNLKNSGVFATCAAGVITINVPIVLSTTTYASTVAGSVVCTLAALTATNTWPLTLNGKTYQKPKFCENFGDRMVFAGFPDASTQYDVIISNQGSAEKFSIAAPILATDAYVFTVRADLGPIQGVKSFQPNSTDLAQILVIGQRDGISINTGDNTTNYKQALLTTAYGLLNNRCWAQVLDDLVFMSDKGVYTFSSLAQNLTKPTDALSYVVSDRIKLIDPANSADLFCVHHPQTQEVQFWFPYIGDSGQNRKGLILCYNTDSGSAAPVWSTKDLGGVGISCAMDFRNVMYGGSYDGYVQLHYNGDTYDTSTILFDYVSSLATLGNLMQAGRMQSVSVVTDGDKQKFAINTYYYSRFMDGSTRKRLCTPAAYSMGDSSPGQTLLPFPLGNSSFPSEFVKTHKYSPIGRGLMFEFELTNTNTTGDGLDYSRLDYTISIGGLNRR